MYIIMKMLPNKDLKDTGLGLSRYDYKLFDWCSHSYRLYTFRII